MNTYSSNAPEIEIQRRQLEKLWQPTPAERLRRVAGRWMQTAGKWLVQTLAEGDQPRVWIKETRQGTRWFVHDPIDGRAHQFTSEEAMRVWLEQRYNG